MIQKNHNQINDCDLFFNNIFIYCRNKFSGI
nr:MAG TPA: hypothetical protein [Caudoviricetes sp.]